MEEIQRHRHRDAIVKRMGQNPIVVVLGPRQIGKTTLIRQIAKSLSGPVHTFDLEDPQDLARLAEPGLALRGLEGTVVLDEVQKLPGIFSLLRVLVDRRPLPARFLLSGSASPELIKGSSQTLAGRISHYDLEGFKLDEVPKNAGSSLWIRGGFPASFLAADDDASNRWRDDFTRTYLTRDISDLGIRIAPATLRRFWAMLAHYHGQTWNGSELARAFGVSNHTVRGYLDLLTSLYLVRQLQPCWANLAKRQVKAPKIYLADSGILHSLLGIQNAVGLQQHPKVGASWEGFAIEAVINRLGAQPKEVSFWSTHNGAEVDLVFERDGRRFGFEVKHTDAPRITRSMHEALSSLDLTHLFVLHTGHVAPYTMAQKMTALPVWSLRDADIDDGEAGLVWPKPAANLSH